MMRLLSCSLVLATVSASPSAAVVSGGGGGGAGDARLTSTAFQASADDQTLIYGGDTSQSLFSSPTSSSGDDSRGFWNHWNEGEGDDEAGGKEKEEDGASALAAVGRGANGSGLHGGVGAGTVPVAVSGRALKSVKSPPSVASAKSEKVATLPSSDSGTTGATKPTTLSADDARSSSKKVVTLPSSDSVTSETSITSDSGTTGTTEPTALSVDDVRSSSKKVATLPSSDSASPDSGTTGTTKPTTRSWSNEVATLSSSETSITTSRSTRSLGAGEDSGSGKGGGKKRFGGRTGLSKDESACDCLEMCGDIEELIGFSDAVEYAPSMETSMTSSDSGISKEPSLTPSASGDTAIEAKAEKNGPSKSKEGEGRPVKNEAGSLSSKGGSKTGSKTGRSIGSSSEKISKGNSSETSRSSAKSSKGGTSRKLRHVEAEDGKTAKKAKGAYECFDFCGCDGSKDDELLGTTGSIPL